MVSRSRRDIPSERAGLRLFHELVGRGAHGLPWRGTRVCSKRGGPGLPRQTSPLSAAALLHVRQRCIAGSGASFVPPGLWVHCRCGFPDAGTAINHGVRGLPVTINPAVRKGMSRLQFALEAFPVVTDEGERNLVRES